MFIQPLESLTSFYVDHFTPKLSFLRMVFSLGMHFITQSHCTTSNIHAPSRFTQLPHHTVQTLTKMSLQVTC